MQRPEEGSEEVRHIPLIALWLIGFSFVDTFEGMVISGFPLTVWTVEGIGIFLREIA
jgi:hypothetical protein